MDALILIVKPKNLKMISSIKKPILKHFYIQLKKSAN